MDRFRELEIFTAVVDGGSLVNAAGQLRLSKAAVSRSVASLEQRLGARLLNRTTRSLSLTEAGRSYYEQGRQILVQLDAADSSVGASTLVATGELKISAPQTFGALHLAPLWSAFMQRHPAVTLDITLTDRIVDLVDGGFDMAIRITSMPDSTLVSRRLASTRMLLCASPAYLAQHGTPSTLDELGQHQVIAFSHWLGGDVWCFDGPTGEQKVLTSPRLRTNSGATCHQVALSGGGICLAPGFLVSADVRAGRLHELLPDYRGEVLDVYAIYPSRRQLSVKVRVLVDFLVEALAQADWDADA